MPVPSPEPYHFPTTHWSLIGRAGQQTDELQRQALNELLTLYWPALHAHLVVKKGLQTHEADDLVQSFIENKVLEQHLVARADAARGKFRTLLATALDNYVVNEWERRSAKKRAPDRAASLPAEGTAHSLAESAAKDTFEIAWARQTLAETLRRMQDECGKSHRDDVWEIFVGRVTAPILEGSDPISYEEIVRRFPFRSPSQASNALVTGKRLFVRTLRSVVAEYASDDDEVENEIRDLINVLTSP